MAGPIIYSFTADPTSVNSGGASLLTPTFDINSFASNKHAYIGTTSGGQDITNAAVSGSTYQVNPTTTTTYYLELWSGTPTNDYATASVTVTVTAINLSTAFSSVQSYAVTPFQTIPKSVNLVQAQALSAVANAIMSSVNIAQAQTATAAMNVTVKIVNATMAQAQGLFAAVSQTQQGVCLLTAVQTFVAPPMALLAVNFAQTQAVSAQAKALLTVGFVLEQSVSAFMLGVWHVDFSSVQNFVSELVYTVEMSTTMNSVVYLAAPIFLQIPVAVSVGFYSQQNLLAFVYQPPTFFSSSFTVRAYLSRNITGNPVKASKIRRDIQQPYLGERVS